MGKKSRIKSKSAKKPAKRRVPAKGTSRQAACGCHMFLRSLSVDDLDLVGHAKAGAEKLLKDFPTVVFTSGRRTIDEQADAMAGNVEINRKWIEQTYLATPQSKQLQKWVDDNPQATSKADIKAGLLAIMEKWSEAETFSISRHIAGLAFDVYPVADPEGKKIKDAIGKLKKLHKFFDKEGGLVIWHAQFEKT